MQIALKLYFSTAAFKIETKQGCIVFLFAKWLLLCKQCQNMMTTFSQQYYVIITGCFKQLKFLQEL